MPTTTFDTLYFFNKLKSTGMTDEQAQVHLELMQQVVSQSNSELATRTDIYDLQLKMEKLRFDLLKWGISALIAQTALLVAVLALIR